MCGATLTLLAACNIYDDGLLDGTSPIGGNGHSAGGSANTGGSVSSGGSIPTAGEANGGSDATGGTGSTAGNAGSSGGVPNAGAGGVPSTGGTAGSASGGSGAGANGGTGHVPTTPELIDDMEDRNRNITPVATPQRRGAWYLSSDVKAGATQTPDPKNLVFMTDLDPIRVEGSARALYTTAKGHEWALVGFDVNNGGTRAQYDASAYVGISFYARVESDSIKDVRLQFLDATTDPDGAKCDATEKAPVDKQCRAHFGRDLLLTTEWKLYEIYFSQLFQPDWGLHADALDAAHLYSVQFSWSDLAPTTSQGMKLWIDDISFLKPAP